MTKDEFLILYQKFLKGECTQEEIEQLHAYQDDLQLEDTEWDLSADEQMQIREAIRARLQQSIATGKKKSVYKRMRPWLTWRAAALLTGLIAGAFYLFVYRSHPHQPAVPVTQNQNSAPAKKEKKTWLTLANGRVISLTDAAKGTIVNTSGIEANKQEDGWVTFKMSNTSGQHQSAIPDTNSIQTPYGERFAVTLSDGSKVWLNASSSLRFPVYFTGSSREVYLTGEGCFEVKADPSRPFLVHTNGMAVQAVGTVFNIKSYTEESRTIATLLSGVVHVKLAGKELMLKPGQKVLLDNENGRSLIQQANTSTVLAWRNGVFAFEKETISTIMHEIGRWYNRKVVFVKGNLDKQYNYKLRRNEPLEEALKILELTNGIQFTITDSKIMVTMP